LHLDENVNIKAQINNTIHNDLIDKVMSMVND